MMRRILCAAGTASVSCHGNVGARRDLAIMEGRRVYTNPCPLMSPPCGSGTVFAKEAVDQLTYNLTADAYKGRVVVVLAGYPEEMDEMFKSVNPGFASRFRQRIHFPDWDAVSCRELRTTVQFCSRNSIGYNSRTC